MTDTITHTAWAYSADGTDRFTTVYPNLNLLNGSMQYTKDNPKTLTSNKIDGIQLLTEVYVKNLKAGTYTINAKTDGVWVNHLSTTDPEKHGVGLWLWPTTESGIFAQADNTVPKVITVTRDGDYCIRLNTYSDGITNVTQKFWDFKLEEGSIATQQMPSSSEVKTADYPSYIGTYSDTNVGGSTDPSKYTWVKINTVVPEPEKITVTKGDFATNSGKYNVAVGGASLDPLLTTLGFNDETITVVKPTGGGFDYFSSVEVTISEGEVFESGYVEVYDKTNTLLDTYTLKYIEGSNKAYYQYKYNDATTLMKVYITFYIPPTDETVVPTFNHVYSMLPSELDQLLTEGFGADTPSGTIDLRTFMLNLLSFPFSIPPEFIGEREKIVLGEHTRKTESTALKGDIIQYNLGSIEVPLKYKNAYDFYSAETTLILPYTENISLPPEYVIGATISVEYVVEVYKGTVNINVTSSKTGKPIYNGTTSIGRQIPFISYWKILGDESIYTSVYNNQTKAIIEVKRKQPLQLEYGTDVSEYGTIGDYTGYIEVTEVGLIGSTMGGYEQEQLLSILNKGVIL